MSTSRHFLVVPTPYQTKVDHDEWAYAHAMYFCQEFKLTVYKRYCRIDYLVEADLLLLTLLP